VKSKQRKAGKVSTVTIRFRYKLASKLPITINRLPDTTQFVNDVMFLVSPEVASHSSLVIVEMERAEARARRLEANFIFLFNN